MLNNLTNLFNLIKSRMVKTVLEDDDLFVVGTRDRKYDGNYKPTIATIGAVANAVSPLVPPKSSGLFAQTGNSTPITGTTTETTLIDGGVGSLSVPANGFAVGDSFRVVMNGIMDAGNNETLQIRVKSGSVVLLDSTALGLGSGIINDQWTLYIDFTIRALGTAGVAEIAASGKFSYLKTTNGTVEGFGFSTINNTTFNTTIGNTLDITAEWGSNDPQNSIYSEVFTLTKTY